MNEVLESGIEL